jgi:hypothetical protein
MSLAPERIKALAIEIAAAMPPEPAPQLVLLPTGKTFTADALALAERYDSATSAQRAALDAIVRAFR